MNQRHGLMGGRKDSSVFLAHFLLALGTAPRVESLVNSYPRQLRRHLAVNKWTKSPESRRKINPSKGTGACRLSKLRDVAEGPLDQIPEIFVGGGSEFGSDPSIKKFGLCVSRSPRAAADGGRSLSKHRLPLRRELSLFPGDKLCGTNTAASSGLLLLLPFFFTLPGFYCFTHVISLCILRLNLGW